MQSISLKKIKRRLVVILTCFLIVWILNKLTANSETDKECTFKSKSNQNIYQFYQSDSNLDLRSNKLEIKNVPKNHVAFEKIETIFDNIKDLQYFMQNYISILETLGEHQKLISSLKSGFEERTNVILADVKDFDSEQKLENNELNNLSNEVFSKINKLQNSIVNGTCKNLNVFVCDILDKIQCGFGCQIHHFVRCMMLAFYNNKPMVLKFNWPRPLQSDDSFRIFDKMSTWNCDDYAEASTLRSYLNRYPHQIIPEPYLSRLKKHHFEPIAWWAGHFAAYLMHFSKEFEQRLHNNQLSNMPTSCVGVHVRRTDKVMEAQSHSLSEYMTQVAHYYDFKDARASANNVKQSSYNRCVFLTTDEPQVIKEAREKYSQHYEFFIDETSVEMASQVQARFRYDSIESAILDVVRLASCEFLVCTFSSNLCRLAYELMQTRYNDDASWRFRSLDDLYYFHGIRTSSFVCRFDHLNLIPKSDEIKMIKGDEIAIYGNHWNGYSKGKNLRTGQEGLIPTFKLSKFY